MLYNHNQVQLTGRLAASPDFNLSTEGIPRCRFVLLQDSSGPGAERDIQHFICIGWGNLAQRLYELVRANDRIFVQGRLFSTASGERGERIISTEIHLEKYVLLKSPRSSHRLLKSRNRMTGNSNQ